MSESILTKGPGILSIGGQIGVAGEGCCNCCCPTGESCCKQQGPGGICCPPARCCGTEEAPVCCQPDECCVNGECGPCETPCEEELNTWCSRFIDCDLGTRSVFPSFFNGEPDGGTTKVGNLSQNDDDLQSCFYQFNQAYDWDDEQGERDSFFFGSQRISQEPTECEYDPEQGTFTIRIVIRCFKEVGAGALQAFGRPGFYSACARTFIYEATLEGCPNPCAVETELSLVDEFEQEEKDNNQTGECGKCYRTVQDVLVDPLEEVECDYNIGCPDCELPGSLIYSQILLP
jgi:hypothetical protein